MKLDNLIHQLNRFAPPELALHWDNVGLQLGSKSKELERVFVALTIDDEIIAQALAWKADVIVAHHPLIFKPLTNLAMDNPVNNWINSLIRADIAVFVMHTNLDIAPGGVNDALAEFIGMDNIKVLSQTRAEQLYKLVVYIPPAHQDKVSQAIFQAGAGHIGNYSDCGFFSRGQGSYRPGENTKPFIGHSGELAQVEETRFETIVKEQDLDRVISGMMKAHPYEEVAYDVFPVRRVGHRYGLGRYGKLSAVETVQTLASRLGACIKGFKSDHSVEKLALCGGSGADLISKVAGLGIKTYVTGDVKYHDEVLAKSLGLTIIDMGHYQSEFFVLKKIERYLKKIYDNKVIVKIEDDIVV